VLQENKETKSQLHFFRPLNVNGLFLAILSHSTRSSPQSGKREPFTFSKPFKM